MNAATNLFNFLIANNYDDVTIMTDYDGTIVRGDDVAVWVNNNGECAVTGTVARAVLLNGIGRATSAAMIHTAESCSRRLRR